MNRKNTAVKRIHADVKELTTHPSPRYHANPLDDDIFEWHFTIRGPADSDFAGGIYHGRILLSPEYPFKPPHIIFLTKNGRFEVGTKICLSISAYHPEHWQPAWGVRTMLEAIISFLPSEGAGAIGALDWTPEERKKLAIESHSYVCPVCGAVDGLIELPEGTEETQDEEIRSQISQLHMHGLGGGSGVDNAGGKPSASAPPAPIDHTDSESRVGSESGQKSTADRTESVDLQEGVAATGQTSTHDPTSPVAPTPPTPAHRAAPVRQAAAQQTPVAGHPERDIVDDFIFYGLLAIGSAICYLLLKKYKILSAAEYGSDDL